MAAEKEKDSSVSADPPASKPPAEEIFCERRSGRDRRGVPVTRYVVNCRRKESFERRIHRFGHADEPWWLQVNYLDAEYVFSEKPVG